MAVLGKTFKETSKANMPGRWFPKNPHTHVAVEDAIEQGYLFMNILAEASDGNGVSPFSARSGLGVDATASGQ
jgi:hypothetical protein